MLSGRTVFQSKRYCWLIIGRNQCYLLHKRSLLILNKIALDCTWTWDSPSKLCYNLLDNQIKLLQVLRNPPLHNYPNLNVIYSDYESHVCLSIGCGKIRWIKKETGKTTSVKKPLTYHLHLLLAIVWTLSKISTRIDQSVICLAN